MINISLRKRSSIALAIVFPLEVSSFKIGITLSSTSLKMSNGKIIVVNNKLKNESKSPVSSS